MGSAAVQLAGLGCGVLSSADEVPTNSTPSPQPLEVLSCSRRYAVRDDGSGPPSIPPGIRPRDVQESAGELWSAAVVFLPLWRRPAAAVSFQVRGAGSRRIEQSSALVVPVRVRRIPDSARHATSLHVYWSGT